MIQRVPLAAVAAALSLVPLHAQSGKVTTRPPVFTPIFDAKNFPQPTNINNRYFPLVPGTTFVYEATRGPKEHDEFSVTHDTTKILKIDCVVIHDVASAGAEPIEETIDFFHK